MQGQITTIVSARIGVLYRIYESSQWNIQLQNTDETKQRTQWRFEARTQENDKQDHDGTNRLIQIEEKAFT